MDFKSCRPFSGGFRIDTKTSHLIIIYLMLLACGQGYGQDSPAQARPLRSAFGMSGGMAYRQASPDPLLENGLMSIFTYRGKPQSDWFGDYYAINEKGQVKKVFFREIDFDLNARYTLFNERDGGWYFNAACTLHRYSFSFQNDPSFQFKGYDLSIRNGDLETWGMQVGVARFWPYFQEKHIRFFFRLGGSYYFRHTLGGFNIPANESYVQNFVENGTGFTVSYGDRERHVFAFVPEIGMTLNDKPVEIALYAHVPSKQYVFQEKYDFYRQKRLLDETYISYSTFHTAVILRVGFTFFKTYRSERRPDPSKTIVPEPVRSDTDFDRATNTRPFELKILFEEGKSELMEVSFEKLDKLADWLLAHSSVVIQLNGHTDRIGDPRLNQKLSVDRVVAVKNYLTLRGVAYNRVEIKGFGDTRPLDKNCPSPCPSNRRVEMIILKR